MPNRYTLHDKAVFEAELEQVNRDIIKNTDDIKEARGHGDLSENAEYSAAKELESKLQGRKLELEYILANNDFIDDTNVGTEYVSIGNVIRVKDLEYGDEDEYTLVGSTETDPFKLYISNESPIGSALLGARVGDIVTVTTPGGKLQLQVLDIRVRNREGEM